MAALDFNRAAALNTASIFSLAAYALRAPFAAIAGWADQHATRKALGQLTDRELDDIGLCRGDIDRIAGR